MRRGAQPTGVPSCKPRTVVWDVIRRITSQTAGRGDRLTPVPIGAAAPLQFHRCRSEARADCEPAHTCSSSAAERPRRLGGDDRIPVQGALRDAATEVVPRGSGRHRALHPGSNTVTSGRARRAVRWFVGLCRDPEVRVAYGLNSSVTASPVRPDFRRSVPAAPWYAPVPPVIANSSPAGGVVPPTPGMRLSTPAPWAVT